MQQPNDLHGGTTTVRDRGTLLRARATLSVERHMEKRSPPAAPQMTKFSQPARVRHTCSQERKADAYSRPSIGTCEDASCAHVAWLHGSRGCWSDDERSTVTSNCVNDTCVVVSILLGLLKKRHNGRVAGCGMHSNIMETTSSSFLLGVSHFGLSSLYFHYIKGWNSMLEPRHQDSPHVAVKCLRENSSACVSCSVQVRNRCML